MRRSRWTAWAAVLTGAFLLPASPALGDGKAFHTGVPNLSMPDQRAIIAWNDGVQTLVISTAIDMPGTTQSASAAWVVPLPTGGKVPEIFPVEHGVFEAARAACTPRLVNVPGMLGPWLLAVAVLVWIVVLVPGARRAVELGAAALLCGAAVLALLPALGTSRGGPAEVGYRGVDVLDARRVGAFDTVTLSARDHDELVRWLRDHGFQVTPGIEPVIAAHVDDGWVFVASRLAIDAGGGRVEPHPLGFRFATAEPVYPLRLTGVGNGVLQVELFVFGPGTAKARGFRVERSGAVDATPGEVWRGDGQVRVTQPELAALASGSAWMTRLVGELGPRELSRDAWIEFGRGRDSGSAVYSNQQAGDLGRIVGGAVFLLAAVAGLAARRPTGAGRARRLGWLVGAAALALSTGVAVAATRSVVPVTRDRPPGPSARSAHAEAARMLGERLRTGPMSLDEARSVVAALHAEGLGADRAAREGVGPLQWRIVVSDGDAPWRYEYRDAYGAPVSVPLPVRR